MLGPNLWEFLLGLVAAFLAGALRQSIRSRYTLAGALGSGLLLIFTEIPYGQPLAYVAYGLTSFLLITFAVLYEKELPFPAKAATVVNLLGESSYAFYLFSPIVTYLFVSGNEHFSRAGIVATTIAVSLVLNQLVEKKCIQWMRKFLVKESSLFPERMILAPEIPADRKALVQDPT